MKRLLTRWVGAGLVLGALAVPSFAGDRCCPVKAAGKGVRWVQGYEKGMAAAKDQRRIAVLEFYSKNVPWCGSMEQKAFCDPSIVQLSKRFVMVKVDALKERREAIRYGVRSFPTVLILDQKGKEIRRVAAYRADDAFAADLKEALTAASVQTASR
jgi:hypothetical protein